MKVLEAFRPVYRDALYKSTKYWNDFWSRTKLKYIPVFCFINSKKINKKNFYYLTFNSESLRQTLCA